MHDGRERIAAAQLTLTAIVYGVIPLIVDIDITHILHPAWTSHSRFHVVWQISVNSMLALLSVLLIWSPDVNRPLRLKIGALLGGIALGGFFVAALTRDLYGGTLSEPGGVPPVAGMDANLVVFTPTALMQLAGLLLALNPEHSAAPS